MEHIQIGQLQVSRFMLGGNPVSGFSHLGVETDKEYMRYFTCQRIKDMFAEAERLGVNTFVGRADNHIIRVLMEYWDQGGKIQWFAQTAPEHGPPEVSVKRAKDAGAKACHIHGGVVDYLFVHDRIDELKDAIKMIQDSGLAAAIGGHMPEVFLWAEENLEVDYYMCSYYNSAPRVKHAEHKRGMKEAYVDSDRDAMVAVIEKLSRPVVHYKLLAAGRNKPAEAFAYAAKHLRTDDAVCVGVCAKDKQNMLEEDVRLFEESLSAYK